MLFHVVGVLFPESKSIHLHLPSVHRFQYDLEILLVAKYPVRLNTRMATCRTVKCTYSDCVVQTPAVVGVAVDAVVAGVVAAAAS